ncbi:hypothetical protein BDR26DRAFT_898479 [Obelidium mucronatum]|nr:hypothetical protein BDR26DRAFT_898479 [Obelidium mucronatum]
MISVSSALKHKQLFIHSAARSSLFNDNNLWQAAKSGNLELLARFSTQDFITEAGTNLGPRGLCERGSNGETILHVACLNGYKDCIKWIVATFPELINEGYRKGRYLGQTALHLSVVKSEIGDLEIVEFLIQHGAKVNNILAIGSEFKSPYYENRLVSKKKGMKPLVRNRSILDNQKGRGKTYYGQSILHFAAASYKDKILHFLVENEYDPADVTTVDQYQNNVLHILAYHGHFHVYDYLVAKNAADLKAGTTQINITKERNIDHLTPLQLAIARGHVAALEKMKQQIWTFGMESTFRIPINEIDPLLEHEPHSMLRETPSCVIELAVMNQDKEVITHTIVDSLLKWKWVLYARKLFLIRFITAIAFTLFLTVAISLQPVSHSERKTYSFSSPGETVRFISEVLSIILAAIMLIGEVRGFRLRFKDFAHQIYHYCTGPRSLEIIGQWTFTLLTLIALPLLRFPAPALFPSQDVIILAIENIVFGISIILSYLHLLSFAKGFETTGPLVVVFKRVLMQDLVQWLWLYLSITLGVSATLFLQMQGNTTLSPPNTDWQTYPGSFVWVVRFLFNDVVYDDFRGSSTPLFTQAVFLGYCFMCVVLLVNVLIAKLCGTFADVTGDSKRVWKVEFASLILDIDAKLSSRDKRHYIPYLGWHDGENVTMATTPQTAVEPRYFLFTERLNPNTSTKETVRLVVGGDESGRRIEFVPFPHKSYWHGGDDDLWGSGWGYEWLSSRRWWGLSLVQEANGGSDGKSKPSIEDIEDEWMKMYTEWEVGVSID